MAQDGGHKVEGYLCESHSWNVYDVERWEVFPAGIEHSRKMSAREGAQSSGMCPRDRIKRYDTDLSLLTAKKWNCEVCPGTGDVDAIAWAPGELIKRAYYAYRALSIPFYCRSYSPTSSCQHSIARRKQSTRNRHDTCLRRQCDGELQVTGGRGC